MTSSRNSRGNAFIYILIAVVLFGALTFALTGSQESNSTGELDEGRATIAANEILSYATNTQNAIVALDRIGTSADEIDFVLPTDTVPFNAAPHINKLFHPEGGGLSYKSLPAGAEDKSLTGPKAGYYVGRFNNWYDWSPTDEPDVIFAAYGITKAVCAALNKSLTGSSDISTPDKTLSEILVDGSLYAGTNSNIEVGDCNACEDKSSLCLESGGVYGFYSIAVPR